MRKMSFPLALAGFADNGNAVVEGIGPVKLDSRGEAVFRMSLTPFEVRTLAVRPA